MSKTDEMLNKIDTKLDSMQDSIHHIDKEVALQKATIQERTEDILKVYEELKRMNDTLQVNTESLKEHMLRTKIQEDISQKMDARLTKLEIEKIEQEAVQKYRKEVIVKWGKILGVVATAIGVLSAAKPLLIKLLAL